MKKLIQVFIVAVSFSLMSGSASGEVTDIRKQIKLCHEVSDSLKRLTCYDSLAKDSLTQTIEFKDLIKVFSFDEGASWNVLPWTSGSDNNSINWLTKYPVNNKNKFSSYPNIKKGRALVLINGTSCKEFASGFSEESVYWDIALLGAHAGVFEVRIAPGIRHCYEQIMGGYFGEPYTSAEELGCDYCSPLNGEYLFQVKLKNKKTIFLSEARSCGSRGCDVKYHIFENEERLISHVKKSWDIK